MFYIIIAVIILAAVLLVVVVLAQNPKGGGVSSQFGGSGASQLIGVKKTGDLLEKLTWGLAISILVLSLASNVLIDANTTTQDTTINPDIEKAIESQGNVPLKKAPTQNAFPIDTTSK